MNVPMLIVGIVLLVLAVFSRGFGKPAWWYPPRRPGMDKVALVVMPLFGLLAILAALADTQGPGQAPNAALGLVAMAILLAMVIGAFVKVPRWVMPTWLRDEYDAKNASADHGCSP